MTDTNADMDVKPEEQPIIPAVVEKRDDGIVRPGDLSAKLLACRERAELDQDQAAIAMRLSPAMIRALESENFADLPDPPYVRGYLRSYARLDESNPQDLIRTYELLRGADPDSLSMSPPITLTRVHKPSISPTTIRMLGLGAIVLFLGVLSMIPGINQWVKQTWQSFAAAQPGSAPTLSSTQKPAVDMTDPNLPPTGKTTDLTSSEPVNPSSPALASSTQDSPTLGATTEAVQPTTAPTPSTASGASTNSPSTSATSLTTPANTITPAVSATAATTPTTAVPTTSTTTTTVAASTTSPATAATSSPSTGNEPVTLASSLTNTDTPPTTAATDPAVIAATGTDPNKPTDTSTTQQPIDGEVTVRMEFTQEVWMQVKDGSNKAIFESLNSPNTWKQFKTRTPLSFKIGNAPGVKLYLNGQAYDHAQYTRGSVARFTVN